MAAEDDTMQLFAKFTARTYAQQAQAFLNAYWEALGDDAENIWKMVKIISELDADKGAAGSEVDEFKAHRFLEKLGQTLTVIEFREVMRKVDLDFNRRMSIIEYLLFRYEKSVDHFVAQPQGTNEDLIRAQEALEKVKDEIDKIEKKKAELTTKSEGAGVRAMTAKNELEQLLSRDPTDLNRAVITAEAAVRRAAKAGAEGLRAMGATWWQTRELEELKAYKPRGGIKKAGFEGK